MKYIITATRYIDGERERERKRGEKRYLYPTGNTNESKQKKNVYYNNINRNVVVADDIYQLIINR